MKLKDEAIGINKDTWYYEEKRGICIVHQVRIGSEYIQTDEFYIPWKHLLESVKRKYPKGGV